MTRRPSRLATQRGWVHDAVETALCSRKSGILSFGGGPAEQGLYAFV